MHTLTHGLVAWVVAGSDRSLDRRDRAMITFAGVAPDLDGLGIVPQLLTQHGPRPLLWFSDYHHLLAHNLGFVMVLTAGAALLSRNALRVAALVCLSVHLHFLGDLVGSGGIDGELWSIPYLLPFASRGDWVWSGQWALNAWPNFVVTTAAIAITLFRAWRHAVSPLELISLRANAALVETLRLRFGCPAGAPRPAEEAPCELAS